MRRLALLTLLAALAAAPAHAYEPGKAPEVCSGGLFADVLGDAQGNGLNATARAQRIWGLAGIDVLRGSAERATCLFGGAGDDDIALGGADVLIGSVRDDVLYGGTGGDRVEGGGGGDLVDGGDGHDALDGGAGNDAIDGDGGVDAVVGGDGDDWIDLRDGNPEVALCGEGTDIVVADRVDALVGCETVRITGSAKPLRLRPSPGVTGTRGIVRVAFRAPVAADAGRYRVLLVSGARGAGCAAGPVELTTLREVRAGQTVRVGLRPPHGGWCEGVRRAIVVVGAKGRPPVPVARVEFSVR